MSSTALPRRRDHWDRRRKIAVAIVALIFLAPFVMAGWYARNITNAISDAQSVSVVDLPARQAPVSETADSNTSNGIATPDADLFATPANTEVQAAEPRAEERPANNPSSFDVGMDILQSGGDVDPREVWPDTRFLTIMVLGVDTRQEGGDQNADVVILARLDLQEGTLRSISIPRDLQVEIPGYGPGKINSAYNLGIKEDPGNRIAGVAKMRDTVEDNFGVVIDDYVMIDFDGFKDVVDAVGGIEVNVPEPIVDEAYPTEDYGTRTFAVEAGPQHMDGETALAYARTRHQDSDDQRRERQMLVIQALLKKGQEIGSITRIADLITALSGAAQTSFKWEEQLALASMALELEGTDVRMANLAQPVIQPGTAADGAWIYTGDMAEIQAYVEGVLSGEIEVEATPIL